MDVETGMGRIGHAMRLSAAVAQLPATVKVNGIHYRLDIDIRGRRVGYVNSQRTAAMYTAPTCAEAAEMMLEGFIRPRQDEKGSRH